MSSQLAVENSYHCSNSIALKKYIYQCVLPLFVFAMVVFVLLVSTTNTNSGRSTELDEVLRSEVGVYPINCELQRASNNGDLLSMLQSEKCRLQQKYAR